MKSKMKQIQIFRHIVQLILLFLSPGLFILAFGELKNIYTMLLKGNLNFLQALPSLTELVAVLLITVVLGRFFCGWVCAFGTFNDWLYMLSKNVFKIKFKVNEKVDAILKYVKYIILVFVIVVVWTMGSQVFESSSPWGAFAQITDFPQVLSVYTIGSILLALIAVGAFFVERFFCRYLCPLGAVFSIVSKVSIFKIRKPSDKCGKCRLCTQNCSMGLPLYKMNSVCGGDCINCLKCVETCPRKNTQANILGQDINPALASSAAIAAMVGVYALSSIGGDIIAQNAPSTSKNVIASSNAPMENNKPFVNSSASDKNQENTNNQISNNSTTPSKTASYKNGTYTGIGTGFRGGKTKISVTVQNGKITNLTTVSNQDTPRFYSRVEKVIMDEILSTQSSSVDAVSGATFSCRGIMDAVQDALNQAKA